MSEYIITNKQLDRFEIPAELFTEQEIVRCRDCTHLNIVGECPCGFWALENLDGFCAWGERRDA